MSKSISHILWQALSQQATHVINCKEHNVSHEEFTEAVHIATLKEIEAIIRTEKLKLLAELDKSMPTAEQLATKYGYHMPEKQYGYKLALHDIREVLTKMEEE